jgi:hypothetical protein
MKFLVAFILTLLLGYLVHIFNDVLPWWTVALAAAIAGAVVPLRAFPAWLAGFLGIALLWAVLAWFMDKANEGLLTAQMAEVLPFKGNIALLYLATALIGGLVGGFGALAGHYLRRPAS